MRRSGAALLLAGALLAGCGGTVAGTGVAASTDANGTQTEVDEQTYRQPFTKLVLDSDSGGVDLAAGADGEVGVKQQRRWDGAKPVVTAAVDGDTLRITARCPTPRTGRCQVDFTIRLPAATGVDVQLGAGGVTVRALSGPQRLRTSAGGITASGLGAAVDATTKAGGIKLSFATAPSSVTAETNAGAIDITLPQVDGGYRVDGDTRAGRRTVGVDVNPASSRLVTAKTGAGAVSVRYG